MGITIHTAFLPHDDPDAALAFYRDALGFEVRNDVGYGGLRWITVGPADQPGTSIVLEPPAPPGCGVTDEERRTITEMMAKGSYAHITLATADLDGTFERLEASGGNPARTRLGPVHAVPEQDERARCSFCGKHRCLVAGLAARPFEPGTGHPAICTECVSLCNEILAEEFG